MEPRVDNEKLEASFVRISRADGFVVGAGFLVSERHVLTCAHVVAEALGIRDDTPEIPQGIVNLDFPFHSAAAGTVQVEHWQPRAGPETHPSGDIAVLQLATDPPNGARPAHLTVAKELFGREFRAYGFPKGHDAGVWAYGVLRDQLGNRWLQVEDIKGQGRRVEPGFSGGPVEDRETGCIVGMVVASTRDKTEKVGFVIPAEVLAEADPQIEGDELSDQTGHLLSITSKISQVNADRALEKIRIEMTGRLQDLQERGDIQFRVRHVRDGTDDDTDSLIIDDYDFKRESGNKYSASIQYTKKVGFQFKCFVDYRSDRTYEEIKALLEIADFVEYNSVSRDPGKARAWFLLTEDNYAKRRTKEGFWDNYCYP